MWYNNKRIMARLETQINQIYYVPAEGKQVSLVLTEEVLSPNAHLFILADLVKIQKKTEGAELKKITEILLNIFRENKRLTGEALFETSLAQINQQLADLAHEGKKSWLGKFSALVVLKVSDNVYLSNTGQMTAMLYRAGEFLEVLNPEKRGLHPLKTFSNFTAGKLKTDDCVLLTTSNLFNYVALQNLTNMMDDHDAEEVTQQVSKILKDTSGTEEGFASFFVTLTKIETVAAKTPAAVISQAAVAPITPIREPEAEEIYAPIPKQQPKTIALKPSPPITVYSPESDSPNNPEPKPGMLTSLPKVSLPKISVRIPKFAFWQSLSTWAKFFLISFLIFLVLFAATIINLVIRKHKKVTVDQTQSTVSTLVKEISDAESALIYRNQSEATRLLSQATADLATLKNINPTAYHEYQPKVADLSNRINHITVIDNPTILLTLKHPATNIARAGNGFFIADADSGTVTTYNTNANDKSGKDLFLLNKIGQIQGLVFIPNPGGVVITGSEMYSIDTAQSQFNLLHIYPKTDLKNLHFVSPERLYTIDKATGQVLRIQFSKDTQIAPVPLLKTPIDMTNVSDIGTDTDIYVLSNNDLVKYTGGNLNTSFKIVQPTDKITSANKLFVANNIYVVESAKKRLLVYNKTGTLLTQMFLPNATDLRDIYVDESSRNIYLLDNNRILSITF
jgi:hypothetical protein